MNKSKDRNRIVYLEILRILSALMVIFNHTERRGFWCFADFQANQIGYWVSLFFSLSCKVAVPVFFAISGALLFSKEFSIRSWIKKIVRMGVILCVFSLIYYLNLIIPAHYEFSVKNYITMMLAGTIDGRLWYLYSYIGFLLASPFIRFIARGLDRKHFLLLVLIGVVLLEIFPSIQYFMYRGQYSINTNIVSGVVTAPVLFSCIGYYLAWEIPGEAIKRMVIPMWGTALFELALGATMTTYLGEITGHLSEADSQQFMGMCIMNCVAIVLTVKYLSEKINSGSLLTKAIIEVGGTTFGVYLLHMLFLERKWMLILPDALVELWGCSQLLAGFVWTGLTFVFCSLVTWVLKKIPVVNSLVS